MRVEIVKDFFIEVADDSLEAKVFGTIAYAKAHIEFLQSHDYEERDGYDWHILANLVDETWDTEYHDLVYNVYNEVNFVENEAYREYAEADFLEYASHKDEADFDWNYYSDWHKDIYGFRPRG